MPSPPPIRLPFHAPPTTPAHRRGGPRRHWARRRPVRLEPAAQPDRAHRVATAWSGLSGSPGRYPVSRGTTCPSFSADGLSVAEMSPGQGAPSGYRQAAEFLRRPARPAAGQWVLDGIKRTAPTIHLKKTRRRQRRLAARQRDSGGAHRRYAWARSRIRDGVLSPACPRAAPTCSYASPATTRRRCAHTAGRWQVALDIRGQGQGRRGLSR